PIVGPPEYAERAGQPVAPLDRLRLTYAHRFHRIRVGNREGYAGGDLSWGQVPLADGRAAVFLRRGHVAVAVGEFPQQRDRRLLGTEDDRRQIEPPAPEIA